MNYFSRRVGACLQLLFLPNLLLLLAIHPQPARGQEHDDNLKQQFLQEAPARWEEYVQRAEMLQGKITFHMFQSPGRRQVTTLEYKTNGRGTLCTFERKTEKEDEQNRRHKNLYGANPKYAFYLQRTAADAPWTLVQIVDLSKENLPDRWRSYFHDFAMEATQLVRLDAQPLSEIVQSRTFRVDRCRAVQRDGEALVEIGFTYERELGPGLRAGPLAGTLVLDPKRFWCLRSVEYTAKFKNDDRFQSATFKKRLPQLGEASGSFTVPKLYELDREFFQPSGQKVSLQDRGEYDLDLPRRLPGDEEFTLSAFGLPEPPGLEWKRPTPWYLWLGLAGIVCLALAVGLRKIMKRRTAST